MIYKGPYMLMIQGMNSLLTRDHVRYENNCWIHTGSDVCRTTLYNQEKRILFRIIDTK